MQDDVIVAHRPLDHVVMQERQHIVATLQHSRSTRRVVQERTDYRHRNLTQKVPDSASQKAQVSTTRTRSAL